jgi:hypothetical protein
VLKAKRVNDPTELRKASQPILIGRKELKNILRLHPLNIFLIKLLQ